MNRRHYSRLLWLFLLPMLLSACGQDNLADLEAYVRQVKARPPGKIEPLPEIKPVNTFVYEPGERRDPFAPDQDSEPEEPLITDTGPAPDPNRRKEELEGFSLDSLRMVGTLQLQDTLFGLIRTKEGILHRVRVGQYMGMNHGQITNISEDKILLTEIVSDAPGQWRERDATVALTK